MGISMVSQELLRSLPPSERVNYESGERKIFAELQEMFGRMQKKYSLSLRWLVEHYEMGQTFPWNCLSVNRTLEGSNESGRRLDYYDCDFGIRYFPPDRCYETFGAGYFKSIRCYETFEEYLFRKVLESSEPNHDFYEPQNRRWLNKSNLEELSREFAAQTGLEWENFSHSGLTIYRVKKKGLPFRHLSDAVAYLEQNLRSYLEFGKQPLMVPPQPAEAEPIISPIIPG